MLGWRAVAALSVLFRQASSRATRAGRSAARQQHAAACPLLSPSSVSFCAGVSSSASSIGSCSSVVRASGSHISATPPAWCPKRLKCSPTAAAMMRSRRRHSLGPPSTQVQPQRLAQPRPRRPRPRPRRGLPHCHRLHIPLLPPRHLLASGPSAVASTCTRAASQAGRHLASAQHSMTMGRRSVSAHSSLRRMAGWCVHSQLHLCTCICARASVHVHLCTCSLAHLQRTPHSHTLTCCCRNSLVRIS